MRKDCFFILLGTFEQSTWSWGKEVTRGEEVTEIWGGDKESGPKNTWGMCVCIYTLMNLFFAKISRYPENKLLIMVILPLIKFF